MTYTNKDKAEEAEREVKMRKGLYPNYVATGRISAATSKKRIEIMEEIARDYRALEEKDRIL